MPKLPVKGLPSSDNGRLMVRLNLKHRGDIKRWGIASLTNNTNSKSALVLMLGHENDKAIFMPFDIRTALEVQKGGQLDFTVGKVCLLGRVRWYLSSPDPAVWIPAWLSVLGLLLGLLPLIPWGFIRSILGAAG